MTMLQREWREPLDIGAAGDGCVVALRPGGPLRFAVRPRSVSFPARQWLRLIAELDIGWQWRGDKHWFRRQKRWVVLNPQTSSPDDTYGPGWSECGKALTTSEFSRRIQATLDFLKVSNRPFWTNVVEDHKAFLNSIEE